MLFTQAVLGLLGRSQILSSPAFLGASGEGKQWKFDFTGASKYFFSVSGVILAIGAIAFATKQLNLGIDFESGTRIKVALAEPASVDEVRTVARRRRHRRRRRAKIQEVDEPEFGANVIQIQAQDPARRRRPRSSARSSDEFGLEGGDAGLRHAVGRPDVRRAGRRSTALIAIIFSLLVICGLRRDPVRGQVRGAGADRAGPRHPDHRRHLLRSSGGR